MTPLEVRRRPPRLAWRLAAAQALIVVGGLLLVPASLALVVLGHPGGSGLAQDIGLMALGVALLVRGLRKLPATRALVARPVVLRLDDVGVEVLGGAVEHPQLATLAWDDVMGVELRELEVSAEVTRSEGPMSVLRFVPRDDSRVRAPAPDGFTLVKATALGLSPVAAQLALLQGRTSAFRVPLILDWLREHRPDVPVTDARDAAHPG